MICHSVTGHGSGVESTNFIYPPNPGAVRTHLCEDLCIFMRAIYVFLCTLQSCDSCRSKKIDIKSCTARRRVRQQPTSFERVSLVGVMDMPGERYIWVRGIKVVLTCTVRGNT